MTERVPIASIQIGERRRQDLGDIASLARNIEAHGLIHPIVVSSENELIAGERRLRAHQYLGLDTIEVRRWAVLDPDEQREIELAENLDRKDLTPLERSRNVVQLADVAAEVDRAEAEKNPRSLECWRAEHRVMLAIGNMGFDDVETATEDLASLIDEHFHFDVAADARPAESYVPQVAA